MAKNDDALHRLETFPMDGAGKFRHVKVENIFPKSKATTGIMVIAVRMLADYKAGKKFKTTKIQTNPANLIPTQFGIFRVKIKNDIEDTSKKPIIVGIIDKSMVILDGHHRAASAILTGRAIVNTIVIET